MSGYTPTTDEVREAVVEWCWSRRMFRPELEASDGKEFDRWLASVKTEAWDGGYLVGTADGFNRSQGNATPNPYRLEQS